MSQDYFNSKGKAPQRSTSGRPDQSDDVEQQQQQQQQHNNDSNSSGNGNGSARPGYMTVGSGSASVHAAHLQNLLNDSGPVPRPPPSDSGYGTLENGKGGLVPGSPAWESATGADSPMQSLAANPTQRAKQASAVHQLWYNQHRGTLGRAINRVMDLLRELQEKNAQWPAHYPSVQRPSSSSSSTGRPGMQHTFSAIDDLTSVNPIPPPSAPTLRRAATTLNASTAGSSKSAEQHQGAAEPRLVTPQIAQEFSILKLDLKLGSLHQAELVHSLEKASIASLLDGKISSSLKHLASLRERIEDTSSKVLITGDLNAGKSTFCNALLRRKILPEDQQPCTSIFCEVLDARENSGIEEVHAVHKDTAYNRNDETTYDVFSIAELEKIVVDNSTYMQCKVYVKDVRTIDESLLNNGVVDIALIDAPGLNSDTTKTTAVFARQEEIDVVVFVVSAANHFTMTAKEFIWAAAAEKAYLFMVVNGYDTIRDQERCKKMILEQVHSLSPQTSKESSELVHFVSSNAIPTGPPPSLPGGPSGSGDGDDGPSDDPKGKGKEKEKLQDFQALEQSLRRFVLEKRARSKLAPARTYLMNILNDIHSLATVNSGVAQSEKDRVSSELRELEPQLESSKKSQNKITEEVNQTIDETCDEVYSHTRNTLNHAISRVSDDTLGVPYSGLFNAYQFAEELKEVMLERIQASVADCEDHARDKTINGVNIIKQLGILHLGNEYAGLEFRSEYMFRRQRDAIARQIDIHTELWDFVDWSTLVQRQEKVAGTGMALTLATAVGSQVLAGYGWMDHAMSAMRLVGNDNMRRLILPGILLAAVTATAYVVNQIPKSLPQRISNKITTQLTSIDYVHANANRISRSVRKVLRMPANDVVVKLQQSVESLGTKREQTLKVKRESDVALKYFSNLVRESAQQRTQVEGVNLDDPPPGAVN